MRIGLIPYIVKAILIKRWSLAGTLFLGASITDMLDGALARLLHEQTTLGVYLDPLADKLLMMSCYVALALPSVGILPWWFVIPIIIKELLLLAGGMYLKLRNLVAIKPTLLGKLAMALQVLLITLLLFSLAHHHVTITWLIYVLVCLLCIVGAAFGEYLLVGLRGLLLW